MRQSRGFIVSPLAVLLVLCLLLPDAISVFRRACNEGGWGRMLERPADARAMPFAGFIHVMKDDLCVQPTMSGLPTIQVLRKPIVYLFEITFIKYLPRLDFRWLHRKFWGSPQFRGRPHDSVCFIRISKRHPKFRPSVDGESSSFITIVQGPSDCGSFIAVVYEFGLARIFRQFDNGFVGIAERCLHRAQLAVVNCGGDGDSQERRNVDSKRPSFVTTHLPPSRYEITNRLATYIAVSIVICAFFVGYAGGVLLIFSGRLPWVVACSLFSPSP